MITVKVFLVKFFSLETAVLGILREAAVRENTKTTGQKKWKLRGAVNL